MSIDYPNSSSEFEIQAELYHRLKEEGFDVKGEVYGKTNTTRARFDLVIFDKNQQAFCLIEVKSSGSKEEMTKKQQLDKYWRHFLLPVIICEGIIQIDQAVKTIKKVRKIKESYKDTNKFDWLLRYQRIKKKIDLPLLYSPLKPKIW